MRLSARLAFGCYTLAALAALLFGSIYLLRSSYMPYHADAVGLSWMELDPNMQTLLLALMRVAGGGFLATGAAIVVLLLFPCRRDEIWGYWAVPLVGLSASLPTLYATHLVNSRTPANPPWEVALATVLLLLIGAALSVRPATRSPRTSVSERYARQV
jgi:hypothetical protein